MSCHPHALPEQQNPMRVNLVTQILPFVEQRQLWTLAGTAYSKRPIRF